MAQFPLFTGPNDVGALRAYLNQLVNALNNPTEFTTNMEVDGTLTVDGATTLTGAATLSSTAHIVGAITADSDITQGSGTLSTTKTVTAAAMGTNRVVHGQVAVTNAHVASGTAVGVRGQATMSGVIDAAGGPFVIGSQGKLILSGTMNHADSRLAAMFAQLDDTGATETTGQLSVLWVDHGAGITGAHGGQFNMIRITDTVAGSKGNAVVYAYANATYAFSWDAPSGTISYVAAAGTSAGSAGDAAHCASQKVLVVSIGEVAHYIPVFTQNT